MLSSLPYPDLLIYLHADVKRLQYNIKKRGRAFELDIKDEYLESIQESYLDYLKKQRKSPVLILDITNVDFIDNNDIYNRIKGLIDNEYQIGVQEKIIF